MKQMYEQLFTIANIFSNLLSALPSRFAIAGIMRIVIARNEAIACFTGWPAWFAIDIIDENYLTYAY